MINRVPKYTDEGNTFLRLKETGTESEKLDNTPMPYHEQQYRIHEKERAISKLFMQD